MGEAKRRASFVAGRTTAGSNYVLVIEWLAEGDRKTGSELAQRIGGWGESVVLRQCNSAGEVLSTLHEALDVIRTDKLVPVIHLEAHGIYAPLPGDPSGIEGPNGLGGVERLLWGDLGPVLGEINLASRLQLLLVGAACHSFTVMDGWEIDGVAPFSAVVAFGTQVNESRLFESMVELYRQLLQVKVPNVPEAVKSANRELSLAAGEALITFSFMWFARALIAGYARDNLEPTHRDQDNHRMADQLRQKGVRITDDQMGVAHRHAALSRCQRAVSAWFAFDKLPWSRAMHNIDVEQIFRDAGPGFWPT